MLSNPAKKSERASRPSQAPVWNQLLVWTGGTNDAARLVAREEVDALHHGVSFQQLPALVAGPPDDRAIVSRPDAEIRARNEIPRQLRHEPILAVAAEFHGLSMPLPCA